MTFEEPQSNDQASKKPNDKPKYPNSKPPVIRQADDLVDRLVEASTPTEERQYDKARKDMKNRRNFPDGTLKKLMDNEELPKEIRAAAQDELQSRSR